jgi:sulfite exporter TauE/SafE
VVVCLLAIQPALGYAHHRHFLKHQRRGPISHVHIWYGRVLMLLGVINGGLGLQLADARKSLIIAYGVVAGIMFLVYAIGTTLASMRKKRAVGQGASRIPSGERGKNEGGSPE